MTPRYKLRTLLILLAILPPLLWFDWTRYEVRLADWDRQRWESASLEHEKRWLAAEIARRSLIVTPPPVVTQDKPAKRPDR